jgi:hypothetical protein
MGIGLVIAVLGVGSTLASTITINSGQNSEFGQGVERTVYCGGEEKITVTPLSGYINNPDPEPTATLEPEDGHNSVPSTPPGSFYLSGIRVSDIPEKCSGVDFVLSVYPSGSANQPILIGRGSQGDIVSPAVFWRKDPNHSSLDQTVLSLTKDSFLSGQLNSDGSGSNWTARVAPTARVIIENGGFTGGFTVTFNSLNSELASIDSVSRILIETQDDTFGKDSIQNNDAIPTTNARIPR